MDRKRWDEAVIVLRKLFRQEPGSVELVLELSRALVYSGRREEALSLLGQSAGRRGLSAVSRAQLVQRAKVLSRIFLTQTTHQAYQDGLGLAFGRKYKPARDRLEKAAEVEPDNVEILLRLGQVLSQEGDHDSAAERLKLARKLNPWEPQVHLWLGRSLRERGELNESLEELKQAWTELSGSELAALWYAETLDQAGHRAAALAAAEPRSKSHPEQLRLAALIIRLKLADPGARVSELGGQLEQIAARASQYKAGQALGGEGELGLDLRDEKELRQQLEALKDKLQRRQERHVPSDSGAAAKKNPGS